MSKRILRHRQADRSSNHGWYGIHPTHQPVNSSTRHHAPFLHGLRAPLIQNSRARFYFTERGWDKVGRFVASHARKKGFLMRVIRRKNPSASQIVYQDDLQIALLVSNGWKKKG
jgi:hypothetical protein